MSEGWKLSTCAACDNSWTLPGGITSPIRQSWWQQDWRHCKISCPSERRHCLVMSFDASQMFLHTTPYGFRRTSPLVGSLTSDGRPQKTWCSQIWTDVGMSPRNYWDVAPVATVATVEWRNGPQGLRDDDDDDEYLEYLSLLLTLIDDCHRLSSGSSSPPVAICIWQWAVAKISTR